MNPRALVVATVVGTVLQLVMVVVGHSHPAVAHLFAVGGMTFSFVAGLTYAVMARGGSASSLAIGGLVAGGACALIGIFVSYMLKDVPAAVLGFGTVSSAVTGAIGGFAGRFLRRGGAVAGMALLLAGSTSHGDAQPAPANPDAPARTATATATTRDFRWLAGRWEGHVAGMPGVADLTVAPPAGGVITGVMRLVNGGKVAVVELISLVDSPEGLELRFRHFSSALEAYEPTFKQALRLTRVSGTVSTFQNVVPFDRTLMSTQPRTATYRRVDDSTFVGQSDILGSDGKPGAVEATYHRVRD